MKNKKIVFVVLFGIILFLSLNFISANNDSPISSISSSSISTCNGVAKITLGGNVVGCRKGRITGDYDVDIPVNLKVGESKKLVVQSNVRVRKQSNCGTFVWGYTISCSNSGQILVNGDASRIRDHPAKGTVDLSEFTKAYTITQKFFNSGDSLNGYINPEAFLGNAQNPSVINYDLDFGGMYYKNILNDACIRTNPATTSCSCPTGYTSKQTWGFDTIDNSYPNDNKVFYCYREHQEGRNGFYDFGGMFGDSNYVPSSSYFKNPATDSKSCPSGYTQQQLTGQTGVDYNSYYCYRPATGNSVFDFGGMIGDYYWAAPYTYAHVLTGNLSCPTRYTKSMTLGAGNIDWGLYFCYAKSKNVVVTRQCFLDKDNDRYSTEDFVEVDVNVACPNNFYEEDHFIDLDLTDCNDNNPNVYRLLQGYIDNDRDTYGVGNLIQVCSGINLPLGYSTRNGDCNDNTANIHPNAVEVLNGVDDNCNGLVDEGFRVNSVSGLFAGSRGTSWIYWTWTNPSANFAKAIIYLDGVNVINTTSNFYNATGLMQNSTHVIRINTLGTSGVINYTNVSNTAITHPVNVIIYNLPGITNVNSVIGTSWIYLNWTNPTQLLTNTLFLNGVNVANTTGTSFNFTNLAQNTSYNFRIHSISTNSSINFNDFSINLATLANPSITSYVNSISGLNAESKGKDWIYWTWTNPLFNFSQTIIYIDGVNVANTTSNYYNATGFSPSTTHTISVYTKSNSGYINQTGISDSATTLSETVTPHTHSSSGSRGPVIIDSPPQIETTDRIILTPSQNYINLTSNGFNENKNSVNGLLILWISLGVLIFVLIILIFVLLLR